MASNKNRIDEDKVSSLTGMPGLTGRTDGADKQKNYGTTALTARSGDKKSMAWLVDLIIILLVAAAVLLAWLYLIRPLIGAYRRSWEERDVIWVLELTDVDPAYMTYDRDGDPELIGSTVLSAPRDDADVLGEVTDAETTLVVREDGSDTLTLRLTVKATVRYRAGDGYSAGDTHLLCGETRVFRLPGLTAEGMILSLNTPEELSAAAAAESSSAPDDGTLTESED